MRKWLKRFGIGILVVIALIGVQFLPIKQLTAQYLPKPLANIGTAIQNVITLGMVDTAYATTPDYTCDGVADNVEVQAALNALPATGGELFFFGGNYVFAAQISRAINNVTIAGSGKSTYFAFDGATALFTAGAQTGWIFKDFRTDAGYLTLADDTIVSSVWNVSDFVSTTEATGDPARTIDIYVSGAGNNANDGLTSATPKLTIQAGVDLVPDNYALNYTIHIASGSYAGAVSIVGKHAIGNVYLTFQGYQNVAANQFSPTLVPVISVLIKVLTR